MSHSFQTCADASFFPTTNELSKGIRWLKDHPVLTAIAATAVTAITYWSAMDIESEKEPTSEETTLSTTQTSVEGKLSATVSWCDQHGCSLTKVFPDCQDTLQCLKMEREATLTKTYSDGNKVCTQVLHKETRQWTEAEISQRKEEQYASRGELEAESPQWGWYVAITPPQDINSSILPRGYPQDLIKKGSMDSIRSPSSILKRSKSGKLV